MNDFTGPLLFFLSNTSSSDTMQSYTWTSEPLLRNALLDLYITKLVFHIDVDHLCEQHEKNQAITCLVCAVEPKAFVLLYTILTLQSH